MAQVQPRKEVSLCDEQLIKSVAHGQELAFEAIYARYAYAVFGLALKMLGDRETAEEVTQDVFARAWTRAASFDCRRSFAPWLFSIAHYACIDELRRRRARPHVMYDDEDHPLLGALPGEARVDEIALRSEQRWILTKALQQLPVEQRQPIELAYFHGLTHQEIADQLGKPLGTTKTRMRLGLQKLRDYLQDQHLLEG
ncbi:MAG: sigma-70 family RNA polymerase sigma factor [Chloroflexota bacterium]|nr:sigma-70 family RNA polymerase sigma factor [Chloroflexota bacterium]